MTTESTRNDGREAIAVIGNEHTTVAVIDVDTTAPIGWVRSRQDALRAEVRTRGALLMRGLPVDIELFDRVVAVVGGATLEYTERSTPRSAVAGNVYTSTEYPADQSIPMHNESSYSDRWPETLFFFCHTAPSFGGATPVADSRAVLRLLSPGLRDRFAEGVRYTRTSRKEIGLSWQETFQTTDPTEVEKYCAQHGLSLEWTADALRTWQLRPSSRREPHTGEEVWFNQANLFHISSLEPDIREALLASYDEIDLPRNAYHADGSPISVEDIAEITSVYDTVSFSHPWRAGDVLVVNNMLMAHGRQPFAGDRRILVAMT